MKHVRFLKLKTQRWWRHNPQSRPLFFFLAAILGFGVTNKFYSSESFQTSWKKNHWGLSWISSDRAPASGETCESNSIQIQDIVVENLRLEKKLNKPHSISGRWLHLKLEKLPLAQALFFQKFPEENVKAHSEKIAHCGDVSCIYSTLSGNSSSEYGALAWNWFLKTGIAIQWSDTDHAFSYEELQQLSTLSHTLSHHFLHQAQLHSIEKVALPEGKCTSSQEGRIKISTLCHNSIQENALTAMSEVLLPDWLESFPNWKLTFSKKSPSYWMNGKWHQEISHFKDLAPQVTQYILYGQSSEVIKDFFKDHLFKRDWSLEGDMKRQFKRDQWVWRDLKNQHLKDCLDLHKTALLSRKNYRQIASLSEPHPLAQCLRETAEVEFLKHKRIWLSTNYERSCEWSKALPSGQVPLDAYLSHWEKLVSKDIDQLEWRMRADGIQWLQNYQKREEALSKVDPTWVYLQCHEGSDPKGCYRQGFGQLLKSSARAPSSVEEDILEDYPFESLDEKVSEDIGVKRVWYIQKLHSEAQKGWLSCWKRGPNEMVKPGSTEWINPGIEFLDGRFANCLNEQSHEILAQVVSSNNPEGDFWKKELSSPLKSWWKNKIAKEAEIERTWLMLRLEGIKKSLTQDMKSLMSRGPGFSPQNSCLTRLTFHYPTRLYFHDRQQLNGHLGKRLCKEVFESEDFKKSLSEHNRNRWKIFSHELQASILPLWKSRVTRLCLGRIPASQTQALLETEAVKGCMREQFELAWPEASGNVAEKYATGVESLTEFKLDIQAISLNLLSSELKRK